MIQTRTYERHACDLWAQRLPTLCTVSERW